MMNMTRTGLTGLRMAAVLGALATLLPGCSSTPVPEAEIAGARAALMSAENQGSTPYAPVEMDRARDKLRRAEQAMRQEDYNDAKRLADEAQADAELAQALTGKAEAEQAVREMEISIEVLREEILRAQGL
ncbi:MAG: DUF4398 domain-containing protein [Pseudomonadales bacterium]|nr:DUF4398 domain-containing protein [Pseudomonadales bacterium]